MKKTAIQQVDFSNPNADKITSNTTASMKQETLKEAAERIYPISGPNSMWNSMWNSLQQDGFIEGAKWQADRMYSEEDMLKCWNAAYIDALAIDEETYKPLFFEDFIKQFKKKREELYCEYSNLPSVKSYEN
jgi:hypothetical protein